MSSVRCAEASLAASEPLAGTAPDAVDTWVLLEVTDPWAPKPLDTEALPVSVRERLAEWIAETPGARLQFIRRPGRTHQHALIVVYAKTGRAVRTELESYEGLLEVDFANLEMQAVDLQEPICLVCVHGRRDRCCAEHGGSVFRAVAKHDVETWQTSHLGGHRFAACAVWLPDGLMYGRLRSEHVDGWVGALRESKIGDLSLFRGRCEYDRPTQAAEIFLRAKLDDPESGSIRWRSTTGDSDSGWRVRFGTTVGDRDVIVIAEELGAARPASCGGDPEPIVRFAEIAPAPADHVQI